jgi:peptidylamidoglycolate lyase
MNAINRRQFVASLSTAMVGLSIARGQSQDIGTNDLVLGQGEYRWKVVPNWGVLDAETPVKDCHAMVQTKDGRIFLLTNETKNNVIIYDKAGKLLGKWGTEWPGAHGFTLTEENGTEVFYLTDHNRHQFYKVSLDGKVLRTWDYPQASGKYEKAGQFNPTHVAVAPDEGFYVVDGYGKSWCHRYDAKGEYVNSFGGNEAGGAHLRCAHGAWVDTRGKDPVVWITSRSESKLKRYTLEGKLIDIIDLPGAEPNFIIPFGELTIIPHLRGNGGQKGKPNNGFISILDEKNKIISNLAAPAADYSAGALAPLGSDVKLFTYPHGLLLDDEQSIYVAQWNSGKTYPIKLQRVKA